MAVLGVTVTALLPLCLLLQLSYQGGVSTDSSLYAANDSIVLFEKDNIYPAVYGSSKPWLVEFYAHWCGHCIRFASTWKELALEMSAWYPYVKIGAINCALSENSGPCSHFSIVVYPTIKFFGINVPQGDQGSSFSEEKSLRNLRKFIIANLENQTRTSFEQFSLPEFYISHVQLSDFGSSSTWTNVLLLIFDKPDSYLGKTLIFDLHTCSKLILRLVPLHLQKDLASKYGVLERPCVVALEQDRPPKIIVQGESSTRKNRDAILNQYAHLCGSEVVQAFLSKSVDTGLQQTVPVQDTSGDVSMQDILKAARYSLFVEAAKRDLSGQSLQALKDWVNLLLQCVPFERTVLSYIAQIDHWLFNYHSPTLKRTVWLEMLDAFKRNDSYMAEVIDWKNCKGSRVYFRGYPCGLWTLFHTMLVNCAYYQDTGLTGLMLMQRIRGFVDHFFGCSECRMHFLKMASNLDNEVTSKEEAVLWLWRSHNRVNARLRDSPTADPQFPKVQFPSPRLCEDCYRSKSDTEVIFTSPNHGLPNITWNRPMVVNFLRSFFGPSNIRVRDQVIRPASADTEDQQSDSVSMLWPEQPVVREIVGDGFADTGVNIFIFLLLAGLVGLLFLFLIGPYYRRRLYYKVSRYTV